jgi:hypothetical protein
MRQDGSPPGFTAWFIVEKKWYGASRCVPLCVLICTFSTAAYSPSGS